MLTVAIYGSRHQLPNINPVDSLLSGLSARGCRLIIHSKLYSHLCEYLPDTSAWNIYAITDTPRFCADLAISIGGDGTFLRTARWVADKMIPIVGINTGHLGYLTAFDIAQHEELIEILFKGQFSVESRQLIRLECDRLPRQAWPYALNEVAIVKNDSTSMINVTASLNDAPLAEYMADGLIVATPTGSTGYNLSVGGPVMQPESPVFVVSPIAAHSLTMRPLVINDTSVLTLTPMARAATVRVSLDGNSFSLPCGSKLRLSKAPFTVRLVQRAGFNFADKLREKLLWGVRN